MTSESGCGAVIVCGGRSTRMGQPKYSLMIGEETLLQRIVRTIRDVAHPIIVVAAQDQELPDLQGDVTVLRDELPDRGPLPAMSLGFKALVAQNIFAAYVSGCDTPLLTPEFVRFVIRQLGDQEIAVPRESSFYHPLAGVYRTSLHARIDELVEAGELRPRSLIEQCDVNAIELVELKRVDPELDSLQNVNTPEEYDAILQRIVATG